MLTCKRSQSCFDNVVTQSIVDGVSPDVCCWPPEAREAFTCAPMWRATTENDAEADREREKFIVAVRHKHSRFLLVNFAFSFFGKKNFSSWSCGWSYDIIDCDMPKPFRVSSSHIAGLLGSQERHFPRTFLFRSDFASVGVCVCKSRRSGDVCV